MPEQQFLFASQMTTGRVRTATRYPHVGVSLKKRRRWFSGDGQDAQTPPAQGGAGGDEFRLEDLAPGVQRYIKELRAEAAQRRVALDTERTEAAKREQARLAEEGKWKELAEARAAELAKVTPYQERATTLESLIRENNQKRVERVREELRPMIPTDYPPEKLSTWLDANWERLVTRPAPETDAGAGGAGGSGRVMTLTAEEKEMAARFGLTEEQYIAAKKKAGTG